MSRQHDTHTFDMFGEAASAHPALSSTPELLALCERWVARGWLRDLDRAWCAFSPVKPRTPHAAATGGSAGQPPARPRPRMPGY